jgi:hypothetical protein
MGSYQLFSRPPIEFSYEAAKVKLMNLDFCGLDDPRVNIITPSQHHGIVYSNREGENQEDKIKDRIMRLGSYINFESRLTVGGSLHSSFMGDGQS